jgi:hypothetical protein
VTSVGDTTVTLVAAMLPPPASWPMATAAPVTKPAPVIVMAAPPVTGPTLGLIPVTLGTGFQWVSHSSGDQVLPLERSYG